MSCLSTDSSVDVGFHVVRYCSSLLDEGQADLVSALKSVIPSANFLKGLLPVFL